MLALLHTAPSNIAVFDALLKELAPDVQVRHVVDEVILREVRDAGAVTPFVAERVDGVVHQAAEGADVVLCTCSSIGGLAVDAGARLGERVLRVDRPMAEAAVALGPRIGIAATLQSTLEPTRALVQHVASAMGRPVAITEVLIEAAWPYMERGDRDGYARAIAAELERVCARQTFDAIILAQASMAVAEPLCADLPCPVFSSPRLGLQAALRALHSGEPPVVGSNTASDTTSSI